MDIERTQTLPVETEPTPEPEMPPGAEAGPTMAGELSPEDTSSLPVVAREPSPRLQRAANHLSLDQATEAANLLRDEVAEHPENAEAYALLAMAEEQLNHPHVAVELYEELLRLDPARAAEAQRLESLRSQLAELEAEAPTPEEQERRLRRLQPVALVVLAGAAVLLVVTLALLLVVQHRRADAARQYATLMQSGQYYYSYGDYPSALGLFAQAMQLRPNDPQARQWYAGAEQQARLVGSSPTPPYSVYSPGQSPFPPVLIGPQPGMGQPPPSVAVPPPLVSSPSPGVSPPEPVWPSDTAGQTQVVEPPPVRGEQDPITPPTPPAPEPTAPAPQPSAPPAPPPETNGPMSVILSDRPSSSAQQRATGLRSQGDGLFRQGDYSGAAGLYRQALSAYQQARAAAPEQRQVIDSAIASMEAKISLCERNG